MENNGWKSQKELLMMEERNEQSLLTAICVKAN